LIVQRIVQILSPHLNAKLPRSEKNLNHIYASLYDDKVVL